MRYPRTPAGATAGTGRTDLRLAVSIHAPLRVRLCARPDSVALGQGFNPRTPAGCDALGSGLLGFCRLFQSTHPCGVRRSSFRYSLTSISVSIHAPLRGATLLISDTCGLCTVSIHAPLRGATCPGSFTSSNQPSFQSTHPCGVRLDGWWCDGHSHAGFIHAPLRGATWSASVFCKFYCCFNPRTLRVRLSGDWEVDEARLVSSTHPAGCDDIAEFLTITTGEFQSTHPCGVRRSASVFCIFYCCFNPRTPAGCDHFHSS